MKKSISRSIIILITITALLSVSISAYAKSYYNHDPMKNPKAAADIIIDPDAVYGYSPNPNSTRLGVYAQYDWSDEAFVADMKQQREDYHASLKELYQIKDDMEAQGKSIEEIARAVCNRRNEIRMEACKDNPEELEKLKESNLAAYGNENGGTPDFFYEKYGSWETVIEKAFSTNAGADACLGLYDEYYDTYIIDSGIIDTCNDVKGDANEDGEVNVLDATTVQRYDARLIILYNAALAASDVDNDGVITIIDAAWIQRYDLGMKAPEGIGKLPDQD